MHQKMTGYIRYILHIYYIFGIFFMEYDYFFNLKIIYDKLLSLNKEFWKSLKIQIN